jgi:hypothetical protein
MSLTTLLRCLSCSWSWGMKAPLSLCRDSEYQSIQRCRSCGRVQAKFRYPDWAPGPTYCGHCGSVNIFPIVLCPECNKLLEWVPDAQKR